MFKHQGPSRSEKQNRMLAGYLALIGGFVNSVGFVVLGNFTSHVTGNVGRFANDFANHDLGSSWGAFAMVCAFGCGAFFASAMIDSSALRTLPHAYGTALSFEAALLFIVVFFSTSSMNTALRVRDLEGAALSAAMGMQNSLVTRLSGAVVRTTHLTGVVTDIGIEAARWFRWWRDALSKRLRIKLSLAREAPERPSMTTLRLLVTIAGSFTAGAVAGAEAGMFLRYRALIAPGIALAAGALYAYRSAGKPGENA
jgi:uncharacterized membrane protein YoaK (UPF0700 family)